MRQFVRPACGATNRAPCRAMAPNFAAAAHAIEPGVLLLKLESARTAGSMNAQQIVAWTRQALHRAQTRAPQGS